MFGVAALSLLWFEVGTWFGFGTAKLGSRDKHRNTLIHGYRSKAATSIPFIDTQFEKQTIHATRSQRMVAARLALIIRKLVNTRSFELLVLQKLSQNWPGKGKFNSDVKLFV